MDQIDKKMLVVLWANCRISFRKLGSILGLSGPSAKRRVDRLLESGTIYDFYVVLSEAMIDMKRALVLVRTASSISVEKITTALARHQGIFRILSLLNGNFLVVSMYPEEEGYHKMESFIKSLNGVIDVKFFPIYRSENCVQKGRKVALTVIQKKVLSCLVTDARISSNEIARRIGVSTRRVEDAIEQMQKNRNVIFSVRWKSNLERSISFMLRITYAGSEIDVMSFNDFIAKKFPSEFWYSYLPETESVIFSVFLVDSISDAYRITELAKEMDFVESVETLISYSATTLDPPTRVELIKLLQQDGLLLDYPMRSTSEIDLIV
ncbi:MAG: AsnC family transcriptional regulator [Candidatus Thorarchaeota archaeon]